MRDREVMFFLTESEKKTLEKRKKESGLSMADFLLRCVQGTPVIVIDRAGEILQELKREGNNLNQALRHVLMTGADRADLIVAIANCNALYGKIVELLKGAAGGKNDASL